MIARLTTLLSERIWFIYKQLANTQLKDPLGRMYDALLIQLEKNRIPTNTVNPHTFDFGPKELVNMVGLSSGEAGMVLQKMMENKKIIIIKDKIHVTSVVEVYKQTEYFRKMQKIQNARQENKMQQ
jgi:hypothetical protein